MIDGEKGDREAGKLEGEKGFHPVALEGKEGEEGCAVREGLIGCIDRGRVLDPIELAIAGVMVVMPVGPDHRVDARGARAEELLAEVRGGIDEEVPAPLFDEEGGPEALDPRFSGVPAGLAVTAHLGGPDRVPRPEEPEFHVTRTGSPGACSG